MYLLGSLFCSSTELDWYSARTACKSKAGQLYQQTTLSNSVAACLDRPYWAGLHLRLPVMTSAQGMSKFLVVHSKYLYEKMNSNDLSTHVCLCSILGSVRSRLRSNVCLWNLSP